MDVMSLCWESRSENETLDWGAKLAEVAQPGLVIALHGDLGAGKSVLARGFIRGMGVVDEPIPSPTFTLMNPYPGGRIPVYHFDLYRLDGPEDLEVIGAEEYLDGGGVSLVEWPERGGTMLTGERLRLEIETPPGDPGVRVFVLSAESGLGIKVLHEFKGRFHPQAGSPGVSA